MNKNKHKDEREYVQGAANRSLVSARVYQVSSKAFPMDYM